MLAKTYETFSSLLYLQKQGDESIQMLTNSINIYQINASQTGLYQAMSKRARYSFRFNKFVSGINDQLKLMPISIKTSGIISPRTLTNLNILGLMLSAHESIDPAIKIFNNSIALLKAESDFDPKKILRIHIYKGLTYYQNHNLDKAKLEWQYANELNNNQKNSLLDILSLLLNPKGTQLTQPMQIQKITNTNFSYNLAFLLQSSINDTNSEDNRFLLQICQLNNNYARFSPVYLKKAFVENCLKQLVKTNEPKNNQLIASFKKELQSLKTALIKFESFPLKELNKKSIRLFKLLTLKT